MENKHQPVVTSGSFPEKRLLKLPKQVLLIGAILLLAVVTGGILLATRHSKPAGLPAVTAPVNVEPAVFTQVNNLIASGQSEQAKKMIEGDSSLLNSRDGQLLLGQIALNDNNNDQAIAIYQGIGEKYGWNSNIADLVASCYQAKGDNAQAVVYYQKELDLLKQENKTNANASSETRRVQNTIKELQS